MYLSSKSVEDMYHIYPPSIWRTCTIIINYPPTAASMISTHMAGPYTHAERAQAHHALWRQNLYSFLNIWQVLGKRRAY